MSELYTDKYLPHVIKEYVGFSHNSVLLYIKNVLSGTEKKKGYIMYGAPGSGKTTLAFLLANHFGISSFYSNSSDQRNKKDINADIFRTTNLQTKKSLIILDEIDGLNKSAFKELEKVLKKYKQPIILICNDLDKIPYPIRKLCAVEKFTVDKFSLIALAKKVSQSENLNLSREEIQHTVSHSNSFRSLLHALQFGVVDSNLPEQISTDASVLYSLQGQNTNLPATDLPGLIVKFNDASNSPHLISLADIWESRYRNGYTYGKYIVKAILSSIRNPGIKKLNYPRTYSLIHQAKTGKKQVDPSGEKKSKPKIRILGFKS